MIPRRESRVSGTGGGGQSKYGGNTPYFCKRCGKTVDRRQVMYTVDVCKKCRVKKG
jgi:hypothetical protein